MSKTPHYKLAGEPGRTWAQEHEGSTRRTFRHAIRFAVPVPTHCPLMTPDSTQTRCLIRSSRAGDVPAMAAIYADAVLTGTGSFETEAPAESELARRRDEVLAKGLPWLVAQTAGGVLGYAYATPFRPRHGYRYCLEDSVYLHRDARGQGLGRLLLAELLARCTALGARQMLAVVGDSANEASVALHRSLGFEVAGQFSNIGRKFDRWLDVVMMQRALGAGNSLPPDA